ncbi:hypothetical protein [Jatrophihabitans sp.]|uniref:hypothetical protein n=1 Tax=Jatrophihabitans sp. TaxID=1932789 RepID=UPI002B60F3A1|nr:hypothetical protein [Jatrophihabitans sp.]
MNTIDDRIAAALHARADAVTEADLAPAAPPSSRVVLLDRARTRWAVPLLAAAIVGILAVATVTAVQLSRTSSHPAGPATQLPVQPTPSAVAPTPAPTPTAAPSSQPPSQAPSSRPPSRPTVSVTPPSRVPSGPADAFTLGYQPLWPFGSYADAEQWRTKAGGSQPWHLDASQTALTFTRSYLGFTEINLVTGTFFDDLGAHIKVGYRDPNGQPHTAATLHLVQFGTASDSPWEVVGSDDTTLSLEQPAYGSRVSSPMAIGGHITGVDENIVVSVLASQTDRSTVARVPAGGDHAAWTTGPVTFTQRGVLTLVASTGGHLQQVERFAIHGVHT